MSTVAEVQSLEVRVLLSASPGEEHFFGAISSPFQENTHQFTLASPANVWFDSQTNDASLKWLVTGPNGIVPTPSFGSSVTPFSSDDQNLGLLEAGTYEVKVSTVGNHTGAYSFRVLDMASAPATTITLGASVSATLSPANSTRLYRFSGTAGSTILLDNTGFTSSDPNDRTGDWLLFDSSGRQLGRWGLRTDSERITLATSGTYTLVLQGDVDAVSNPSDPTAVFVVRNVIDTTTALTLGTAVSGNVSSVGQNLNYTFTLAAPTSLWLDSQTNNNNLRWTLTGPTGLVPTTLGAATPFSFGDENLGLLPAGTYRLTVGGVGSSTGAFAFNLLDFASATSFTTGTSGSPSGATQTGALNPANSTRLYKFAGTAGDSLAFDNVSVSLGTNATWRLIDAYGTVIYTANLGSDRSGVSLSTTGTYTLALYGSVEETNTTSYSFRVNYESHTAPPEITGAALVFGTQYDSTTNPIGASVSGEADFLFTLAEPTSLWFDSQTNDGSISWLLSGPTGTVRTPSAGTNPTQFSSDDQSLGRLPAGTYSLKVFGADGAEYAFNLRDFASASSLTLNTSVTTTLSPANSTRLYQFSGTAGSTIFLDNTDFTSSDPNGDTGDWLLFDLYGRQVGSWGLSTDSGRVNLAITGTYTLVLQGDNNASSNPTDPSVTFVVRDMTDITTALTLGTAVSGSFSSIGQNLNYTFTLAAPTSLWFDSQTDNNNLNWILTGPTGIVPTPSVGSSATPFNLDDQDLGLLPAGTYRLTVGGVGSSTGAFAFNLLDFASAASLTLGTSVTATLSPANSTRLYQFFGTAGSTILLDNTGFTTSDPNDRTGDWLLFDSSGRELGSWGLRTDSERITLATSGTHTLVLQGDMDAVSNPSDPTAVFVVRNVIDTTTALTLGTAVSGNVSSIGQNLSYTFTLAAPTSLWFDSRTNNGNLNWILTGPTGIVPIPFVGASVTPFNFDDQNMGLLPAGSYQLTVGGAGSSTGAFAFNLLDFASATSLTLGTSVTATLSPANSTRLYQFSGTAGSTILLDNTGFTTSDPNDRTGDWLLFDSYGRQRGNWGLRTDSGRITLATSGTYTLVLQGAVDAISNPSDPTAVFVVRNVIDTTTALTLGTAVSGNVSSIGQNLSYTFTLAAPTSLWFDSRTNNGNLNWILTGPTGIVPIPFVGASVTPFNFDDQNMGLLPAGSYQLTVGGAGSSTGAFSFNLLNHASATSFSAGTSGSPMGAIQSGVLSPGNSTRLYKFAGTAGDSLTFDNVAISLGTNATWRLIDAYGTVIYTDDLRFDQTGVSLSTTGTYTLALYGSVEETNTTNYSFRVNYEFHTAPPEITGAALVFGTQYDSTTNPIGASVSGEADFQFTLAEPTSLWFDSQTDDASISWLLAGPMGIVRTPSAGTNPTLFWFDDQSLGLLPAGTYSLKVFGGDGAEYAFSLRDFASATSLTLNTSVTSTLSPANSTRLYQFSGTAGSTIFLDNTSFTTSDPDGDTGVWRLFDPYGREVDSWGLSTDSGRIKLANTGTYALVLQGWVFATSDSTDPSATFVVRDVTDIATALTLGTAVSGSFSSIGQNLNYTFTLAAPTSLWFDSQTRNNDLHWTLTGPTGFVPTTFGDETPLSFGDENLGLLPAGTYRLTVGGFGSSTGAFGFNILNLASATSLTLDTSVTSTLSPANSTRLYQFSGTAGSTIFLDNTSFTTSDPEGDTGIWQLFDPYGREVGNWGLSTDSGRIILSKTGTYTLVLQGDIDAVSSPANPTAVFVVRNVIDNNTQLWGTSGDDEITVQHLSATSRDVYLNDYLMGTLTGSIPLTIVGMGGSDTVTIIGTNTSDTFAITPTTVTVGTAEVSLSDIENRIIDGLGGDDTFNYSGANSDLIILGGDGVDTFSAAAAATVFRIDGGASGGVMNHSASTVGVVIDFAAGKLTGVTQSANITSVIGGSRSDAPVGVDRTATTLEDAAYTFTTGDFVFTDPGDSPANALLSISIVGLTLASGDTLQLNGVAVTTGQTIPAASIPNLVYTPAANTHGANRSSFTFQIQDNGGTANGGIDIDPTVRVMTMSITDLNDVPVRTAGTISTLNVLEDAAATSLGLTNIAYGTGGGPDENAQTLTYRVIAVPTTGRILLADGATEVLANAVYTLSQLQGLSFQPTPNANGSSAFSFSVQDSGGTAGGGIDTLTQSINVNVAAVNDVPVAVASSVTTNEDTPRSFTVSNFLFSQTLKRMRCRRLPSAA